MGGDDRSRLNGGLIGLLRLLREHEAAVEADLQRYYQIDYRDRWRADLTLRRLHVLVTHLPPESSTAVALNGGFRQLSRTESLLAEIWQAAARSKHRHPLIAVALKKHRKPISSKRRRKLDDLVHRQRARRAAIERGDIT